MSTTLAVYICQKCGWADFHRAPNCPRCQSDLRQSMLEGVGKIVTYTAIRYPPVGYEDQAPYVVAIISLENGPKVIGRIASPIDDVKIGSKVMLSSNKDGVLEFKLSP